MLLRLWLGRSNGKWAANRKGTLHTWGDRWLSQEREWEFSPPDPLQAAVPAPSWKVAQGARRTGVPPTPGTSCLTTCASRFHEARWNKASEHDSMTQTPRVSPSSYRALGSSPPPTVSPRLLTSEEDKVQVRHRSDGLAIPDLFPGCGCYHIPLAHVLKGKLPQCLSVPSRHK